MPVDRPPFELFPAVGSIELVTGARVGITAAADLPWRYGLADSRFVSRGFGLRPARRSA
jgi:DNA-3-methyladenine glycosylase